MAVISGTVVGSYSNCAFPKKRWLAHSLVRSGTGCRIPVYRDYAASHGDLNVENYVNRVVVGVTNDRTLTPLLRHGLPFVGVRDTMPDPESDNGGVLLEFRL